MNVGKIYKGNSEEICLTEEQIKVLNSPPNILVEGGAGSGKTLLAILLADKLLQQGFSVAIIVLTKSLSQFIKDNVNIPAVYDCLIDYEYNWRSNQNNYEYIIVDEFQDFSLQTLLDFKSKAYEGIYLFGDFNQQLHTNDLNNSQTTIKRGEVKNLKLRILNLSKNYRVPNNIVKLVTSLYYNLSNPKPNVIDGEKIIPISNYREKKLSFNRKDSSFKTEVQSFYNHKEEIDFISKIIIESPNKSIGLLLNLNGDKKQKYESFGSLFCKEDSNKEDVPSIVELAEILEKKTNKKIGYKMHSDMDLCFQYKENINIMTIHSSKGLEFDVVIIPFIKLNQTFINNDSIYVAMTRCKEKLYITYSGYIIDSLKYLRKDLILGEINTYNDDELY